MQDMEPHRVLAPGDAYVLIVEDKTESYVEIARLVTLAGVPLAHCDWKTSGYGVIQFAELALPYIDLILLDVGLPHEDGYEVLKRIRATKFLQNTLVVAVTGHVSIDEMRRAQEAGFDGFLGKPLDMEKFSDQLVRILRGEQVWANR
jgi:two-component system cell cycle response regulator DivK